ncbi:hypothetical protein K493DRAFT_320656 [Basidiobolus meristosporus CBS 931.73]|uniref:Uncharacterized protein n=1 Tax=Basidiobolus meristosporus CBS 931.73 TaxID=1314790 RepID=A0A1Y1X6L5_9FUNG|nr:hypothetical protein K493DRAFT_320656 [Basidiobolus meristosporus CBS 931.73]|eukprot:ORX81457.1 hypothetical protein K493DRAFT_320656 [Basidiobolus meristosporus CBS 931.73]
MSMQNTQLDEKQFGAFLNSLESMAPQVVLDQEGRRRLTVRFSNPEYNLATGTVVFGVEKPVKQRFYDNGYFQTPRISDITSQGESLLASPKFLAMKQNQVGQMGSWQFKYSVEAGEFEDERWIVPSGFECQLKFLTMAEDTGFDVVRWLRRFVSSKDSYQQLVAA